MAHRSLSSNPSSGGRDRGSRRARGSGSSSFCRAGRSSTRDSSSPRVQAAWQGERLRRQLRTHPRAVLPVAREQVPPSLAGSSESGARGRSRSGICFQLGADFGGCTGGKGATSMTLHLSRVASRGAKRSGRGVAEPARGQPWRRRGLRMRARAHGKQALTCQERRRTRRHDHAPPRRRHGPLRRVGTRLPHEA